MLEERAHTDKKGAETAISALDVCSIQRFVLMTVTTFAVDLIWRARLQRDASRHG